MAITGIGNSYNNNMYENTYAAQKNRVAKKKETKEINEISEGTTETVKKSSREEYLKSIQKQVTCVTLETGTGLNTKKDNKIGTITINPMLLDKMQNDPEAEKKYIQTIKDIERAEQTVAAYYDAIGGYVERSSHWYIDENGKYCHFGYVYRDDKLNKKLRREAQENAEELIEKTLEKSRKKKEELVEKLKENEEEVIKGHQEMKIPIDENGNTETYSGAVAFNEAKRARQLAAAKSMTDVRVVMSLLTKDLSDCQNGLATGMCDENEVNKVKAMIQRAAKRMSEVSAKGDVAQEKNGFDTFSINMLL